MADDLLVSDSLTACAMAQFALYPENGEVLRHLLGSESPVFLQSIPISGVSSERSFEQWADVRDFLRTSTGEIAIALRGFDRQSGIPRVTMNPKDDAQISLDDDVVVLTRLNIAVIQSDDGRE
jgi:uncharacterized protein (DUF4415 family)